MLPTLALADCLCDTESNGGNKSEALKYKFGAITSIFVAGVIGVCIPILGRAISVLQPDGNIFFIIKAFAAGVILATGFIHVLPDAFENLTSPCLNEDPWGKFPFTGFVAMVAAIGTFMVDSIATSYFNRSQLKKAQNQTNGDEEKDGEHQGHVDVHTHATHGHSHGSIDTNSVESQLLRHRVISKVISSAN